MKSLVLDYYLHVRRSRHSYYRGEKESRVDRKKQNVLKSINFSRCSFNDQKENLRHLRHKRTFAFTDTVGRFEDLNQKTPQSSWAYCEIPGYVGVSIMKEGGDDHHKRQLCRSEGRPHLDLQVLGEHQLGGILPPRRAF